MLTDQSKNDCVEVSTTKLPLTLAPSPIVTFENCQVTTFANACCDNVRNSVAATIRMAAVRGKTLSDRNERLKTAPKLIPLFIPHPQSRSACIFVADR